MSRILVNIETEAVHVIEETEAGLKHLEELLKERTSDGRFPLYEETGADDQRVRSSLDLPDNRPADALTPDGGVVTAAQTGEPLPANQPGEPAVGAEPAPAESPASESSAPAADAPAADAPASSDAAPAAQQ